MSVRKATKVQSSIDWSKQFNRISKYVSKKFGYEVQIKDNIHFGIIDFIKKSIVIKQTHSKELMTYLLLHEIGHILFRNNKKKYKILIDDINIIVSKSSLSFRTIVLYEEMEAWNEGYFLGKKLGIPLDRKTFETYKSRCLKTYMSWVLNLKKSAVLKNRSNVIQKIEENNLNKDSQVHYEFIIETDLSNNDINNQKEQ